MLIIIGHHDDHLTKIPKFIDRQITFAKKNLSNIEFIIYSNISIKRILANN